MSALLTTSVCTAIAASAIGVVISRATTKANATKATTWYAPAFVTIGHDHGHRRPPS